MKLLETACCFRYACAVALAFATHTDRYHGSISAYPRIVTVTTGSLSHNSSRAVRFPLRVLQSLNRIPDLHVSLLHVELMTNVKLGSVRDLHAGAVIETAGGCGGDEWARKRWIATICTCGGDATCDKKSQGSWFIRSSGTANLRPIAQRCRLAKLPRSIK